MVLRWEGGSGTEEEEKWYRRGGFIQSKSSERGGC
jgi:hypothetical protein